MRPISGMLPRTVYAAAAAGKGTEMPQKPAAEAEERPAAPKVDAYTPEEKAVASGRYWVGRDEDGSPKIHFDDPKPPETEPQGTPEKDADPKVDSPGQKRPEQKEERCTVNTDKVDREIRQLKRRRSELQQKLNTETDEAKIGKLQKQLAQVERELTQKDNDTYRRQHTQFS